MIASESYFKDLDRKKDFHVIEYADGHKRGGYWLKWIMRFRPVQVGDSKTLGIKALLANEHFALTVALRYVNVHPIRLTANLYRNMIYSLRFRHIDANAWALSLFLLQECSRNNGGNPVGKK